MKRSLAFLAVVLLASVSRAGSPAGQEVETIDSAVEVIRAFSTIPITSIPPAMLRDARAVAIVPRVFKAGLIIGGRFGRGVLLTRQPGGGWGNPFFITLGGGGIGIQIGVQSTDVILVFNSTRSVDRVLRGQGKITLGGDVSVAAGPVGRHASAATDGQLEAEIYSYSRSRGLFAGVSLEGAALLSDTEANKAYYAWTDHQHDPAIEKLKAWLTRLAPPLPPASPTPPVVVPPVQIPPYPGNPVSSAKE